MCRNFGMCLMPELHDFVRCFAHASQVLRPFAGLLPRNLV